MICVNVFGDTLGLSSSHAPGGCEREFREAKKAPTQVVSMLRWGSTGRRSTPLYKIKNNHLVADVQ